MNLLARLRSFLASLTSDAPAWADERPRRAVTKPNARRGWLSKAPRRDELDEELWAQIEESIRPATIRETTQHCRERGVI
jgi:hypothetical protein